jgi:hypothetical protein
VISCGALALCLVTLVSIDSPGLLFLAFVDLVTRPSLTGVRLEDLLAMLIVLERELSLVATGSLEGSGGG